MSKYGPAGIFSTDNVASDHDQIMEETYDLYEVEDYPEYEEDEPEVTDPYEGQELVHKIFACPNDKGPNLWWTQSNVYEGDVAAMTAKMQSMHDQACRCGSEIIVF